MAKANIAAVKAYFGKNAAGEEISNKEVIAFKKDDSAGYDQIANGLGDGTLTY
jgi:hypothetical protein